MEPPRLTGVLETVLYCDSATEASVRHFYEEMLGFQPIGGMRFSYRVGDRAHVFLVFNRDATAHQEHPPPHGATGPGHTCFEAATGAYETWKDYLQELGVETHSETTWASGIRSFYFEDPAGNVLEIAEGDLWPR